MKRCPWLIWPAFTPANSIGRVFPPQSATSQRTGLANRTPVSFHCIALGNESLPISPGRCWVRTAAADCPFSCLTAQTYSPLAVGLTCNCFNRYSLGSGEPDRSLGRLAGLVEGHRLRRPQGFLHGRLLLRCQLFDHQDQAAGSPHGPDLSAREPLALQHRRHAFMQGTKRRRNELIREFLRADFEEQFCFPGARGR